MHGAGEAKLSRPASARSERLPSVSEVPGAIAQAVASKPPRPQSARMSGRASVAEERSLGATRAYILSVSAVHLVHERSFAIISALR